MEEEKLKDFDPTKYGSNHRCCKTLQKTVKGELPEALKVYEPQIRKIYGDTWQSLKANILCFALGFTSFAVFAPAVKRMTSLDNKLSKLLLGAFLCLSGSIFRLFYGKNVVHTGGKKGAAVLLYLSLFGMGWLMVYILVIDPADVTPWGWQYWLWCGGGFFAGFGIATFPLIINTLYWSQPGETGHDEALFGGLGNITPGLFMFVVLLFFFVSENLKILYILWFVMQLLGTLLISRMIEPPPYFQFINHGVNHEDAQKMAEYLGQHFFPPLHGDAPVCPLFKDWKVWVLMGNYGVGFGGFLTLGQFLPIFLQEYHGSSEKLAITFNGIFLLLCTLTRSAFGDVTDKLGGALSSLIGYIIIMWGTSLFASTPMNSMWDFNNVGGIVIMSIGMGLLNSATFKWLPKIFGHNAGPVAGLVGSIGGLGGFIIPVFIGLLGGEANSIFFITGLCAFMFLASICLMYSQKPKQVKSTFYEDDSPKKQQV